MEEIIIIPDTIQLIKMTDEEYFSDKYKDYISNSKLGLLESGSIESYLKGYDQKYSDSFELGSAVHSIVLQPDSYFISKLNKPTGKLGVFVDKVFLLRKEGFKIQDAIDEASKISDYFSGSLSKTRLKTAFTKSIEYYLQRIKLIEKIEDKVPLYLSASMKEKAETCIANVLSNKELYKLLFPEGIFTAPEVFNEYAIFCEVDVVINGNIIRLKLKGKLDNFTIDHENKVITLNDLKTTGKPAGFFMGNNIKEITEDGEVRRWIDGSFQTYHYYRQMGEFCP